MANPARRARRMQKNRRGQADSSQDPGSLAAAIGEHKAGRIDAAEAGYRRVLEREPNRVPALQYLGVICAERGDYAEAEELLGRAARLAPSHAEVLTNLAVCQRHRESYEACFRTARKALQFEPDNKAARFSRAAAARNLDDFDTALADLAVLRASEPGNVTVLYEYGRAALGAGEYGEAIGALRDALAKRPDEPGLIINLGLSLARQDNAADGLAVLDDSPPACRDYAAWHDARGQALAKLDRKPEALAAYRQGAALAPEAADINGNLADRLREDGYIAEALAVGQHILGVLEADPSTRRDSYAIALNNHANTLREQGRNAEACALYRQALEADPGAVNVHGNLLLSIHYDEHATADDIYREHLAWQRQHAQTIEAGAAGPAAGPADKAPLTVGILAGKQRSGPALLLYLQAYENLDPARVQLIVYDLGSRPDELTQRLAAASAGWRDVQGLSAAKTAAQIRADGVDVLIHKMGHAEGRPLACAHRPAPVQVQWGGFNTTALDGVDWFLGDPIETPPGCEGYFSERIYRLPNDYVSYTPPGYDLVPGPLPAQETGTVTFACFNMPFKINAAIAGIWADLLAQIPNSRLLLKGKLFGDPEGSQWLRGLLRDAGIPDERLVLEGFEPHYRSLQRYQSVDIALDPWPYSGGLTTLEALWMGVPVVTMPGPSFVGRHAASHVSNVGLGDWVAQDRAGYVNIAASWAQDWTALAGLRAQLRERLLASPICDGPRFARDLETALAHMWHQACDPAAA